MAQCATHLIRWVKILSSAKFCHHLALGTVKSCWKDNLIVCHSVRFNYLHIRRSVHHVWPTSLGFPILFLTMSQRFGEEYGFALINCLTSIEGLNLLESIGEGGAELWWGGAKQVPPLALQLLSSSTASICVNYPFWYHFPKMKWIQIELKQTTSNWKH